MANRADNPSINEDFIDLIECLNEAKAEYIVVGAHAMAGPCDSLP